LQSHEPLGAGLPLWSVLPFVGMLLSIALFPLLAPRFWHNHFGKVSLFWALLLAGPFLWAYQGVAAHELAHVMLTDYVPFIILLGALYTISGGILIKGSLGGSPGLNTLLLALGTALASWMGTTGAAMLLIRPFLRANAWRSRRTFMVVFFIFLVANIGGSLTPLGDPPLFLGFLRGVPFFWTMNLLPHMLLVVGVLLALYYVLDRHFYKKESGRPPESAKGLSLQGWHNLLFLAGVVAAVLASGILRLPELRLPLGVHRPWQDVLRDLALLALAALSLLSTPRRLRDENEFTWFPIREVAVLFFGIFVTMTPCLKILQAGSAGALAPLMELLKAPGQYFWLTGVLSSFLDNAPTYLTFLNSALGAFYPGVQAREAVLRLIGEQPLYLEAISAGAVFFGAMTYIGNAPNFMVRTIAEEAGTAMPSFFGYMIKYSLPVLGPLFVLTTLVFF